MANDFSSIQNSNQIGCIGVPLNSSSTTLKDYLFNQGYDIVYLDYNDGTDDIKRNATLLEEVIKWVNNNKVGTDPNIVMGISMGGLVARYALRDLEKKGYDHQTKIYLSMDSPHNGANVPVGLQAALCHMRSFGITIDYPASLITIKPSDYIKQLKQAFNLLNTMAAKQMLIYKVAANSSGILYYDNSVHESFMTEYNNLGFPEKSYNVAISDGSGDGSSLFAAGTNLISQNMTYHLESYMELLSLLLGGSFIHFSMPELAIISTHPGSTEVKTEFSINSTPSTPGNVYHGRVYIRKKIFWFIKVNVDITNQNFNSTSTMIPIDGASGGIYDINKMTDLSKLPKGTVINQKQFCFVPTVSALAANNWENNISNSSNNISNISKFQNCYKQAPTINRLHTSFNTNDYSLANYIKTILDNTSSYCTSNTLIENVKYTNNQTITGCNLTLQNITIQNNSNVVIDATNNTVINGPFEVITGSSIEIK